MNERDIINQEVKDIKRNYTRTPNVLFESYPDLRPQEKWLFINLVYLCGSKGTRHLSLRYIHDRTGISLGALSGSKDPAKNDLGMIRRLHNAGLIHAEIKKKKQRDGKESDQAQYHITIVDIWQINEIFFAMRSENEHLEDESNEGVQNVNTSVRKMNTNTLERSENERERSENDTNIRLHSKTTDISKTTEEENVVTANADANDTPALSEITHTPPTEEPTHTETPEQPVQEKKPRKRTTRRSRASKFEIPEELRPRVKKVYEHLNAWRQKKTGDPEECFTHDDEGDEAICSLFQGKPPTEKKLEAACDAMWNEPRNIRTGYYAREHMTVKAICNQYKAKSLLLAVNENKKDKPTTAAVTPYSLGGYTYKPEDEQPSLPFTGPFRHNRKKRGA